MAAYEIIEHTADIGIRAFGGTLKELFQNTAAGMFSLITDLRTVTEATVYPIEVEAEDRETLLVEWLNELLYLFDSHDLLFCRFNIIELGETFLKAMAYGETVDTGRHPLNTDIKAATYHMLKIEKTGGGWSADVIFDV